MTATETSTAVRRYPIDTVCARLGVPRQDWHLFRRWAKSLPAPKALDGLSAYVDVMIADRCRRSADDLLSELIETGIGGEDLTADELRTAVVTLVTG